MKAPSACKGFWLDEEVEGLVAVEELAAEFPETPA
jgi:hypothetical protein